MKTQKAMNPNNRFQVEKTWQGLICITDNYLKTTFNIYPSEAQNLQYLLESALVETTNLPPDETL